MSEFYVELPGDGDGNTALPLAVVEADIVQGGPDQRPYGNPARRAIIFSAPADYAAAWGGMYVDAYGGYAEVPGPARLLTRDEYDEIIAGLGASTR